jgi:hypothetical protein
MMASLVGVHAERSLSARGRDCFRNNMTESPTEHWIAQQIRTVRHFPALPISGPNGAISVYHR